jgi:hypothetical protein
MVTKNPEVDTTRAQIESLNESELKGPIEMKKKVNFEEFLLIGSILYQGILNKWIVILNYSLKQHVICNFKQHELHEVVVYITFGLLVLKVNQALKGAQIEIV